MVEFWKPHLAPLGHPSECSPRASCFLAQGAGGSCLKIALSGLASVVLLFVSGVSLATLIGGLKHLFSSFALGRDAH